MKIEVRNSCSEFNSYRTARVKSLFNCDSGANFALDVELPIEAGGWSLGVIVGPSGSGKTSVGRALWPDVGIYDGDAGWPENAPIVDAIAPVRMRERVTGGSVYRLANRMDGGAVLAQRHVFVRPDDTARTLWRRALGPLGVELLCQAVRQAADHGLVPGQAQDEALATWEPSIDRPPAFRPDLLMLPAPADDCLEDMIRGGHAGLVALAPKSGQPPVFRPGR